MTRALAIVSLLLSVLSVSAAELPSWFPRPNGLYEIKNLTYSDYGDKDLVIDKTTMKKNSAGYVEAGGKMWRFDLGNPKPEAWTATIEQLQKQGFHFVHGDMKSAKSSSTLQKGEGDHAIYVSFWQCCNSASILEIAPNPFRVTLKPPSKEPKTYGEKEVIPFLPPIDGGKYSAGNHRAENLNYTPGCKGKSEVFAPEFEWRRYSGPANISDVAVRDVYETAMRAAGWDDFCEGGSHAFSAHFTKNGRDLFAIVNPHVSATHFDYEVRVADAGTGFRAELKKNCKASLYGVNFDFDKATLRPDAEPALTQLLTVLKEEPKLVVEIGGHTDNVGKPDYNLKLSDERAASVKQWLIAHGIAANRLSSHGYGDTQPLVKNDNDENRAKNRRVEVKRTDCK